MRHLLVAAIAALTLAACSKSSDAPKSSPPPPPVAAPDAAATAVAPGSAAAPVGSAGSGSAGSGAAAVAIKPYTPAADVPAPIRDAIAAADRSDADRALDAGRKPGEVLAFFHIAPGQHVGELFAGGGYTTELVARVVGDKGAVFAQNTKEILDKFARKPLTERLAKPVNHRVVLVENPAETPFPSDVSGAKKLDAVLCILNYHDFVWQKVDRAKMNAAVFAALKPGGVYGIVDSAAAAKSGTRDAETLHRIDRDVVVKEVTAAGFKLDASSDVLANPSDTHDWNSSPKAAGERRGTSDRFTLRFIKPKK